MKKTHKKIFGLFGLILVVAVTIFAALLPTPETQAVTTEVVDAIKVRVVGSTPAIEQSGITSGAKVTSASQEVDITYENIEKLLTTIKYTDVDGNTYEETLLDNVPVNYVAGSAVLNLNLIEGSYTYSYEYYDDDEETTKTATGEGQMTNFGYGDYTIASSGESLEGVEANASLSFSFWPITATVTQDGSVVSIDLSYDPDDGSGGTGQVSTIVIYIYDENGNVVKPSPITLSQPTKNYTFDMSDYGLASGTYTISVQALDVNKHNLYKAFTTQITYTAKETPVPETGGMMGNLNISKTDYIITGLIIFSIVGISGAVFISRHDKKAASRKRR